MSAMQFRHIYFLIQLAKRNYYYKEDIELIITPAVMKRCEVSVCDMNHALANIGYFVYPVLHTSILPV